VGQETGLGHVKSFLVKILYWMFRVMLEEIFGY
jgi:hypothetical protein